MHVASTTAAPAVSSVNAGKRTVRRLIQLTALFGGAGTIYWERGWFAVAVAAAGTAAMGIIARHFNADLMDHAHSNFREKDTKPFDKIIQSLLVTADALQLAVAGMDAERFHWSSMPFALVYIGMLIFVMAISVITWSLSVNRFAERSVRIQTDRGHEVVDSGPYAIVRHPLYVGLMLMFLAAPLLLGSFWALTVTAIVFVLFSVRTAAEDRVLLRELPGYEQYATRTRYRLLPGVW